MLSALLLTFVCYKSYGLNFHAKVGQPFDGLKFTCLKFDHDVTGVVARKEITTHIAWTPLKLHNWDFLHSKPLNKCLMTASKAFKTGASFDSDNLSPFMFMLGVHIIQNKEAVEYLTK